MSTESLEKRRQQFVARAKRRRRALLRAHFIESRDAMRESAMAADLLRWFISQDADLTP